MMIKKQGYEKTNYEKQEENIIPEDLMDSSIYFQSLVFYRSQ
jgi:hypothetical protein